MIQLSQWINDGIEVNPRAAGIKIIPMLENEIQYGKRTPEELFTRLKELGFNDESADIFAQSYAKKDINIAKEYIYRKIVEKGTDDAVSRISLPKQSSMQNPKNAQKEKRGIYNVTFNDKEKVEIKTNDYNDFIEYSKGNRNFGAKHIIRKHLGNGKDGELTKEELLNMGEIIRNGNIADDSIHIDNGILSYAYVFEKDGVKYKVAVNERPDGKKLWSMYSDRNIKTQVRQDHYAHFNSSPDTNIIPQSKENVKPAESKSLNEPKRKTEPEPVTKTEKKTEPSKSGRQTAPLDESVSEIIRNAPKKMTRINFNDRKVNAYELDIEGNKAYIYALSSKKGKSKDIRVVDENLKEIGRSGQGNTFDAVKEAVIRLRMEGRASPLKTAEPSKLAAVERELTVPEQNAKALHNLRKRIAQELKETKEESITINGEKVILNEKDGQFYVTNQRGFSISGLSIDSREKAILFAKRHLEARAAKAKPSKEATTTESGLLRKLAMTEKETKSAEKTETKATKPKSIIFYKTVHDRNGKTQLEQELGYRVEANAKDFEGVEFALTKNGDSWHITETQTGGKFIPKDRSLKTIKEATDWLNKTLQKIGRKKFDEGVNKQRIENIDELLKKANEPKKIIEAEIKYLQEKIKGKKAVRESIIDLTYAKLYTKNNEKELAAIDKDIADYTIKLEKLQKKSGVQSKELPTIKEDIPKEQSQPKAEAADEPKPNTKYPEQPEPKLKKNEVEYEYLNYESNEIVKLKGERVKTTVKEFDDIDFALLKDKDALWHIDDTATGLRVTQDFKSKTAALKAMDDLLKLIGRKRYNATAADELEKIAIIKKGGNPNEITFTKTDGKIETGQRVTIRTNEEIFTAVRRMEEGEAVIYDPRSGLEVARASVDSVAEDRARKAFSDTGRTKYDEYTDIILKRKQELEAEPVQKTKSWTDKLYPADKPDIKPEGFLAKLEDMAIRAEKDPIKKAKMTTKRDFANMEKEVKAAEIKLAEAKSAKNRIDDEIQDFKEEIDYQDTYLPAHLTAMKNKIKTLKNQSAKTKLIEKYNESFKKHEESVSRITEKLRARIANKQKVLPEYEANINKAQAELKTSEAKLKEFKDMNYNEDGSIRTPFDEPC
ncbi:MAG: hypothetical protein LBP54_03990 [Campylobacteraceae bacterium]|jgi:hypothetical protein|nr:hypothetical protein [Campylobacteraceae bacterium]